MGIETVEVLRADREEVVNFVEHLRLAFEEYVNKRANEGREVKFNEALMAIHNFYKLIILDVERRDEKLKNASDEQRKFYRKLWVDTLGIALLGSPEEKEKIKAKNDA